MSWIVNINKKAAKKAKLLPSSAKSALNLLLDELEQKGPIQKRWPHFSKLKGNSNSYHCHLKRGKPTFVACWKVVKKEGDQNAKGEIEIYYAWTHEGAPY